MKSKRGEVNTFAVILITVVIGMGAWCIKDMPTIKNMFGKSKIFIGKSETITETISRDNEEKSPYLKQAEEIFRVLEENFSDFMKAEALVDFGCVDNEKESWRGRNVFMLNGSRTGFIDGGKFADKFTKALQANTLEINDEGTLFQVDISDISSLSVNEVSY